MKNEEFFDLLSKVNVLNYDNGRKFRRTDRLDAICRLLWNTTYRRVNAQGLFHLYVKKPLDLMESRPVVISSHVDCQENITKCFTRREKEGVLRGTFDNSATNASLLALMLEDRLPENVLVAFTGDEEEESKGAKEVIKYLRKKNLEPEVAMVLDVTDMGWKEHCDFTIENNFFSPAMGERILKIAGEQCGNWLFVPSDPYDIPGYVPQERVIHVEAEPDESWEYDEMECQCFSLCLPVRGNMHCNEGVLLREESLEVYRLVMEKIAAGCHADDAF